MDVSQQATRSWIVEEKHLARSYGSGLVDALATPALVAFCEETARSIPDRELPADQGTVGTSLTIDHVAATPSGMRVQITATLIEIDGRRLRFTFEAIDEVETIARGTHERFVIDKARFDAKLGAKRTAN